MHMDMRMIRITKRKKQKGPERTFCTLLLFSFCHADHAHNPHNADGMDKDKQVGWVTPDYIKRLRLRKSDNININSNNNKDNEEENKNNRKKNVMTASKFDPFGTESDSE